MENKQQKDFDQFFQDKLNNREFDYQDDFWKEMETQLPEAKTATATKGGARKRLLLLLLLMIGVVSVISWVVYPANYSESNFITKGKIDSNLNINSDSKTENVIESNAVSDNEKIGIQDIINNENKIKVMDENFSANNLKSINNNERSEITNSTVETVINKKESKTPKYFNKNTFNLNDNKDFIINSKGSENTTSDEVKSTMTVTQPMATTNKKILKEGKLNSNSKNDLLATTLLTKNILLEDDENEDKSSLITSCDGCPNLPPSHQFKIGLIAGLNTSLGFKNIGEKKAEPSLDPSIGVQLTYRHSFTSSWRTTIEAIYFSRSALNTQIRYDSISYGFGATVVSRSIDIEELHYISMPIYATYQYNKKHAFMGGLSLGYLLNAQSQTSGNVTETTAVDANIYAEPTTQEWGYTTAFNRFDIGATLGYYYEVQKGWKIGTRLNYGLRDITKNNIFNNNVFDNNISLRLVMTCDLFIL
jgi:hypothetical protein